MRDLLKVSVIMVTDLLSFTRRIRTQLLKLIHIDLLYRLGSDCQLGAFFYSRKERAAHYTYDCSTAWGDCESVSLRLTI